MSLQTEETPEDPRREFFLNLLEEILTLHPEGLREYDLYRILAERGIDPFVGRDLRDALDLFQTHFFLFHLLYVMRERLRRERRGDLEIHCLKTVLRPWQPVSATMPEVFDPLGAYYLNLDTMADTERRQVEEMLAGFWRSYRQQEQREQACSVLGLPFQANREEIRQRYRDLAFTHHPDQGGEAGQFQKIAAAAAVLLGDSPTP
ncbi:MAG: DnaJ domain-containing protein [Magnetococcales bacterium]|nr:DnaJ domain-containing protein [Magnetococcales bacterium]